MLVFVGEGEPENPEKKPSSKAGANNKLNLLMVPGCNGTQATLVVDNTQV